MNIVYVSPRNPYVIGGVEYVVQKLAEGMVDRGHNVSVICGSSKIKTSTMEKKNGINILTVPSYSPNNAFHVPKDKSSIKDFLTNNIDIVHAHSAHALISTIPFNLKKSNNPKWKLIYTMHFSTPGYSIFKRLLWKLIWKRRINSSLKYVDAIHSTSEVESRQIIENFSNVTEQKLSLIPLGLDADSFTQKWKCLNNQYVVYCGRLEKYKRIELAVESIKLVREQGHDVDFIVVGKGSRTSYFKKLANRYNWITCINPKPRKEYLELLSNASVAINLSSAENFNLFLAEACVMGVPIVATPNAAAFCPQFANVHKLQPTEVAAAIVDALLQPQTCIFPESSAPPSWNEVIELFEDFYQNTLNQKVLI